MEKQNDVLCPTCVHVRSVFVDDQYNTGLGCSLGSWVSPKPAAPHAKECPPKQRIKDGENVITKGISGALLAPASLKRQRDCSKSNPILDFRGITCPGLIEAHPSIL